MNSIKRQLSLGESLDERIKKLPMVRATCNREVLSITYIENLSNELLYEIFDYLDGYHIYRAFANLNIRFQHLITCSSLPLKINRCPQSKTSIEYLCRKVIIPNKGRIRSLHLKNKLIIDEFLIKWVINSSFKHLESIVFNEITNDKLHILLINLQLLPRLFALTIHLTKDNSYNFNDIYQRIFRLRFLKYNKLSLLEDKESNLIIPSAVNRQLSAITYLVIDHSCSLNQLVSLLQYTPELRHLECKCLKHLYNNMGNTDKLILSHLSYIDIVNCYLRFDEFETFITKISSQLKVLRIITYRDMAYLDADRWEQLISQHIPHLRRFDFDHYHQLQYNNFDYNYFGVLINQFTSPFWINRQWIFQLKIARTVLICTIHLPRMFFDSQKHTEIITFFNQTNNNNSGKTIQSSAITKLIITADLCSATWNRAVMNKINPIFSTVTFTHLHINCNEMFTGTFIKLVKLLPNLDSLKFSSFPFLPLRSLSDEDTQKLILISSKNKITKVSFKGMYDFEPADFIMFLCSHIQHLELRYTKYTNPDVLLRYILMKRYTHARYLSSLYFCVPNAKEELVDKLQQIIYREKLLTDYTIKRFGDNIHLHWK